MSYRCSLLLLLVVPVSGCAAFRAEVGLGFGIGALVKLPYIAHVPSFVSVGKYKYAGHDYDQGWHQGRKDKYWEFDAGLLFIHTEAAHDRFMTLEYSDGLYNYHRWRQKQEHFCPILLPYVFDKLREKDTVHSTQFEIRIYALFMAIRLGFDPSKLVEGAEPEPKSETSSTPDT